MVYTGFCMTKVVFATDHAGFELKNELVAYVREKLGYEVEDLGAHECDPDDDYPEYIGRAARRVHEDPANIRGVILGGSGQGEAMLANRFAHVRAVVYYGGPEDIITFSRIHNDSNILSLGARFIDLATAKYAVKLWLFTEHPPDARYDSRIEEAEDLSN